MILTTVAQSRRHFLTLYDVNTQFKPCDVLAIVSIDDYVFTTPKSNLGT